MKNSDNGNPALQVYFSVTGVMEKTVEWVSALAFFFILAATLLQVFFRYVLGAPLVWTEELARYLGIFMIMLATSNALKKNIHLGIDVLSAKLPDSFQKPLKVFSFLAAMLVMGFLAVNAAKLTSKNFFTSTPAMRIPIGIPYLCMTVSCFISAFVGLCLAFETVFNIQQPAVSQTKGEGK